MTKPSKSRHSLLCSLSHALSFNGYMLLVTLETDGNLLGLKKVTLGSFPAFLLSGFYYHMRRHSLKILTFSFKAEISKLSAIYMCMACELRLVFVLLNVEKKNQKRKSTPCHVKNYIKFKCKIYWKTATLISFLIV